MKISEPVINRPIMMKCGTQTEKNALSPKTQNWKCAAILQDGCRRHLENQRNGVG
jgi:hypothetical protein